MSKRKVGGGRWAANPQFIGSLIIEILNHEINNMFSNNIKLKIIKYIIIIIFIIIIIYNIIIIIYVK